MVDPYLHMFGISKNFPGVHALSNVEIRAYPGEALALAGANGAGKSTLMNILGGVLQPDEGSILIQGQLVHIKNPLDAKKCGIAFVHQEMTLMPTMTVAENMFITGFPKNWGAIDYRETEKRSANAFLQLKVPINPRAKIQDLNPGNRQIVEIARALLRDPRIIIFDEPTSSLTNREKDRLFDVIQSLKANGVAVIYITHMLDEIYKICERVVVLRNGEVVGGGYLRDIDNAQIVKLIVGREDVGKNTVERRAEIGETVLEIRNLSRKGILQDINLVLKKGEILGLWGLLGSGRTELARAIMGLDRIDSGMVEIRINEIVKPVHTDKITNWVGMITEDRREDGLLLTKSIKTNISLANLRALISKIWPLIDTSLELKQAKELVERLGIKISNLEQPASTASGGNQQKIVVARWLQKKPMIYIMDEPTKGIDVGAKAEICNIIFELARSGASILLISSDIDEIMRLSDRFLVLCRGRIVSEFSVGVSKEELVKAAAGA